MKFKLDIPYFGRDVTVIADDNWHFEIIKYGDFGDIGRWYGGFFVTVTGKYIICLPSKPDVGTIVHEVNHCVNEILETIGHLPDRTNDEIESYMLQHFVQKIYDKIYNVKKSK